MPDTFARLFSWPVLQKLLYFGSNFFGISWAHVLAILFVGRLLAVPFSALNSFEYERYYIPFLAVLLHLAEGSQSPELRRPERELQSCSKAVVMGFLGLALLDFRDLRSQAFSRYLVVSWFILAIACLIVLRTALRAFYAALWNAGWCRRRTLLLGSPGELTQFRKLLSIQRHHAYEFVGALLDLPAETPSPGTKLEVPILGTTDEWERAVDATGANLLVVACSGCPTEGHWLGGIVRRCKERKIEVALFSGALATENLAYEHDEFSGCFRFSLSPAWSLVVQRAAKTTIDLGVGIIGSIVTLLLAPAIYALVCLDDHGPLFYRSAYVAQDGAIRFYLKFRTMLVNADRMLEQDASLRTRFREKQKLIDDPRVTRIGHVLRKYSLDEFPQFFSVLKGDLSLVGPRTIRQEEIGHYGQHTRKLLSCKPGLTGFWQVMGRQTTTYRERVHMDMFYIDRWSIWLDLLIIAKTFWKVIRAEGAY